MAILRSEFDALVSAILERRPVLKEIMAVHGRESLFDYARKNLMNPVLPPFPNRSVEFFDTFERCTGRPRTALEKFFSASTADHHGPLTSPFFVSPNLLLAIAAEEDAVCRQDFVTVLPGANVSLNNSSFPRGLLFHAADSKTGELNMQRLSFLPSNSHAATLYGFRAYTADELKKIYAQIREKKSLGIIGAEIEERLHTVISEIYEAPAVFSQSDFSGQMTAGNFELFRRFFHDDGGAAKHPDLIYYPQENLTRELLLNNHIGKGTLIDRVLFHEKESALAIKLFDGIHGAFEAASGSGTHFFWGISGKKHLTVSLRLQDGYLVSRDGDLKIEITPDALSDALRQGQLVPSLLCNFLVLALYYGLRCLGGFNQVNYLTQMKNQWRKLLEEIGAAGELAGLQKVETKGLIGDLTVAFAQGRSGQLVPATGLDLILHKNPETWNCIRAVAKKMTLEHAMYPLFAEFYKIVVPAAERKAALEKIRPDDVIEFLGLREEMMPAVIIL